MSINYQDLHNQLAGYVEFARLQQERQTEVKAKAMELLQANAYDLANLGKKLERASKQVPSLRCAAPVKEPLTFRQAAPQLPVQSTIVAADGSQILADRHSEVQYSLINVGAIQMKIGTSEAPQVSIISQLLRSGNEPNEEMITEEILALKRDVAERNRLADLADGADPPVITFTDGPMELWGGWESTNSEDRVFQENLAAYIQALDRLCERNVATAGYVDKPGSALVIRLLELAMTPVAHFNELTKTNPLYGITDATLFREILQPGERSAVFALHSRFANRYSGRRRLHFFYLNVGTAIQPWLARVEIPAWVEEDASLLNGVHAALMHQCQAFGANPYPYLLHRAHEAAVVTLRDREEVTQMIIAELLKRGIPIERQSNKQYLKDRPGRSHHRL